MKNIKAFLIGLGFGIIAVGMLPFLFAASLNESTEAYHQAENAGKGEIIAAEITRTGYERKEQ
ncbi:hypothetical protein GRF59_07285 [Paenibacillus sp. HJL G12]|uniref:Uncharacterized protein n=1 Tax=Paenibacillus dendrobii TaxID=2691084 RepID=A0A7X3IGC4_9BACL|nr:hypothetical protein [Paenibacillus dendrobii]MWV43434.1 hypothetical protein [Paenibacillus dendrobii]